MADDTKRELEKLEKMQSIEANILKTLQRSVESHEERIRRLKTEIDLSKTLESSLKNQSKLNQDSLKFYKERLGIMDKESELSKKIDIKYDEIQKNLNEQIQLEKELKSIENERENLRSEKRKKSTSSDRKLQIKDDLKFWNSEIRSTRKQIKSLKESIDSEIKEIIESQREQTKSFFKENLKNFALQKVGLQDLVSGFKEAGKSGGELGRILYLYRKYLEFAFDKFKNFDEALTKLRMNFGLMRGDFTQIETFAKNAALNLTGMGVTIEGAVEAATSLGRDFGLQSSISQDIVENVALMNSQLGISTDISSGFYKSLSTISSKPLKNIQSGTLGIVKNLSTAVGIPLADVMGDIASASDSVRNTFRGSTLEMIKTAVEARRLGTTMEQISRTNESLLDFQGSVSKEMEASVLIGRNINFAEARRLAFQGKTMEANKSVLRQVKSIGDFERLNYFQRKALADAAGMSTQELQTQIQREKEINELRVSGTDAQKKLLSDYEKFREMQDGESKDQGKITENRIRNEMNQARMNALMNQFSQLMMDLAGPAMDVIEPFMSLATKILPPIVKSISLLTPMLGIFKLLSYIKFPWVTKLTDNVMDIFKNLKTKFPGGVTNIFGKFGKFMGFFARYLGPLGLVINAFQLINNLMKRWNEFPDGVVGGIMAIGFAIYDTLLKPFKDIWDWCMNHIMANSPSKLGLGIVKGILSVGSMIFDALTYPFKRGFDFIMKLPVINWISDKIGFKSEGESLSEINGSIGNIQNKNVESEKDRTNEMLLKKIDELINLMKNGGIAVNLDGVKVTKGLALVSDKLS